MRAFSEVLRLSKRGCTRPFITSIGPGCVARWVRGRCLRNARYAYPNRLRIWCVRYARTPLNGKMGYRRGPVGMAGKTFCRRCHEQDNRSRFGHVSAYRAPGPSRIPPMDAARSVPQLGRTHRRDNIGKRPNNSPIENGYALRRKILPQADAELGCRIQEPFKVAHSTSGKVMQHHDCPGLCTALCKRAIDPSIRLLPVARNRVP